MNDTLDRRVPDARRAQLRRRPTTVVLPSARATRRPPALPMPPDDRARRSGGAPSPGGPDHRSPALSCRELRFTVAGRFVVDGLTFDVQPGELVGLLEPCRDRRTSVVQILCGLLDRESGSVLIHGRPVEDLHGQEAPELVGYVPQHASTLPTLSLAQNLQFWARLTGVPDELRQARVDETLELVGLAAASRHRSDRCPVGVERRLGLAVALLSRPSLLILDEPTAGMDPDSRQELQTTLQRLRARGMAVVLATADAHAATSICDRVQPIA